MNRSLAAGHFPSGYKEAFITPIVEKASLDTTVVSSYRPNSNLSVVSNLLERTVGLIVRQLMAYLSSADLLPNLQSAWFPTVSFDRTAILQVMSELLQAVDGVELGALILLDLTAAFDTVDHDILLQRLQQTFGVDGHAHRWFRSYLVGRTQYVRRGALQSLVTRLLHVRYAPGIRSFYFFIRSVIFFRCMLFIMYTFDLIQLIEGHGIAPHLYADDTQVIAA